jgi:hypothetical protein
MRASLPLALVFLSGCIGVEGGANEATGTVAAAAQNDVFESNDDSGKFGTFAAGGAIDTSSHNPFFANFGTNGRTCGTCHIQTSGWTFTPSDAAAASPRSPLFAAVDGADCEVTSNPDPSTGSTMVLNYGLIRVGLPVPAGAEFSLSSVSDPHHCATPPTAAQLSLFRRPLPSTNLGFLSTVMWDGRETKPPGISADLAAQSNDATLTHAAALAALNSSQQQQMVAFESGLFSGQTAIQTGGPRVDLVGEANGGPAFINSILGNFYIGINDSLGHDPRGNSFNPVVFTIYSNFEPTSPTSGSLGAGEQSIGRGEAIFNGRTFTVSNVPGLNGPDDASQAPIEGATCTTCHDTPNVGNHSFSLALDIGVTSPNPVGGVLDVSNLPVYTFVNNTTGATKSVTDPGRGLITGKWKDLGKTKGPILRGLSARAPYFHNGSARDLLTVVRFYEARFGISFSAQDETDLVAFLNAL